MRNNEWVGKRNATRQNCQMRAEMRFMDGRPPMFCTVVDISASGCRIELPEDMDIPEDFDLFIPSRSETKIAKLRRQDGAKLGVAFLKSRLDDPLVMQTLLERVARLERGYSELKGFMIPPGAEDRRGTSDLAKPLTEPVAAIQSGPLVEHRLKSLAEGLAEVKMALDHIGSAPAPANIDSVAARANETAEELGRLKQEMATLSKALRGLTGSPHAESPDYAADIADMKAEMTKLSVAMRNMAAEMPKVNGAPPASAAQGAEVVQIAKIKADIAQLRAAMDAQQGAIAAPAPAQNAVEFLRVREELAQLRSEMDRARTEREAPASDAVADLHSSVQTLILLVSQSLGRQRDAA